MKTFMRKLNAPVVNLDQSYVDARDAAWSSVNDIVSL